ncbi:hypothetical protein HZA44_04480 [Candidatus Peregrinibacteria bacterium]|nr:hypothetical protein [Candidatus Peregrinibacteria bacterium]
MKENAASMGMEYTAPKGQGVAIGVGIGAGRASISEGAHTFTGKTNGVEWTVKSVVLAEAGTHSGNRMGKQYTRWSSEDFKAKGQDYLILMDLPENMKKELQAQPKAPAGTGFLATMANKMATMAFNMYANGYFGKSQMEGTVFDQTHRQYWPTGAFAENYMVFSSNESFSKKLLDADTMEFILKNRPFEFSFLINSNGIMASCPLFVIEPEKIQTISKFCSELANKIKKG